MKNVLEYLERSARVCPEKPAVEDPEGSLTYTELLNASRRAGSAICARTQPGQGVVVCMEKSRQALCALLGAVYAGCFYIYISPEQPAARLRQILAVCRPGCVLTEGNGAALFAQADYEGPLLDWSDAAEYPADEAALRAIRARALDTDPLYCNFTSGSTGVPKGVLVCHRSVIDFMEYFPDLFGLTSGDVFGNQAPFDFDVSVKDIYTSLKLGATVALIPRKYFSIVTMLLDYLCEKKVTTLVWAVSALCLVAQFKGLTYKVPEKVDKILFSGEKMPPKYLRMWQKALPGARYVNLYGPTEITCNCTYCPIGLIGESDEALPIGVPFPNEKVFLLDEQDRPVTAPGEKGEICVAGTALALGYYNAPEQTARSFVRNPLNPGYPETIFRTGDLAYYGEDGNLFFAGRKDFQVKYMGHRIEPEEIELAVNRCEGVERACCVFDTEKNRLIAFYVGTAEPAPLKKELYALLPVYMIPAVLRPVPAFPVTSHGKIDRAALLSQCASPRRPAERGEAQHG